MSSYVDIVYIYMYMYMYICIHVYVYMCMCKYNMFACCERVVNMHLHVYTHAYVSIYTLAYVLIAYVEVISESMCIRYLRIGAVRSCLNIVPMFTLK